MNLTGSIDLLKLDMAGVATIRGKSVLLFPLRKTTCMLAWMKIKKLNLFIWACPLLSVERCHNMAKPIT